jgi:type I restriction enzyme S subunit
MSSKADTKNMNQEKKCEFKPKLRFPEFSDAGEWEKDELGKISLFINERIPLGKITLKNYVSTENILPDYEGLIIASKLPSSGTATRFKTNDILISNIRPYLKKVCLASKDGGTSNDVIVVRANSKVSYQYLSFILKNDAFIEYVMRGAKGVKMPRGDISLMKEYPLAYPSKQEQQKIADCLSSISDRITLETQKLDTLKAHKKGLMQQLFPAEGETLPKLRLPEFQDSGDWEEQKLGSLVEIFSGDAPSSYKLSSAYGCPYVKVEDMNNCSKYQSISREYADKSTKNLPTGSVIFPKRGAAIMGNKVRIAAVPFYIDSNMMALFPQKKSFLLPEFLYYLVLTQQLSKIADTSSIPQINNKHIIAYTVKIPSPPEQQKIADCLSSLDELIAAQTQAIATLKTHKKGLMQQLFPSVEEVKG